MTERMLFIVIIAADGGSAAVGGGTPAAVGGGASEVADGEFAPINPTEATTRTYVCPQGLTVSTSPVASTSAVTVTVTCWPAASVPEDGEIVREPSRRPVPLTLQATGPPTACKLTVAPFGPTSSTPPPGLAPSVPG